MEHVIIQYPVIHNIKYNKKKKELSRIIYAIYNFVGAFYPARLQNYRINELSLSNIIAFVCTYVYI